MQVYADVGYCAQKESSMGYMTCRETLDMYGRIRGLTSSQADFVIKRLLKTLQLENVSDTRCNKLRYLCGMCVIVDSDVPL